MSNPASKPIRSPSYPNMSLRDAVDAVGKIEAQYRSSPVDRTVAAKLVGYSSKSGPANKALAALASYGLLERAGKGETRVTARARAILHPSSDQERKDNLLRAALEPPLFREIRERFDGIPIPPESGVVTHLHRQGFNPVAIRPATKAFLQTMGYLEELRGTESHGSASSGMRESGSSDGDDVHGGARVGDLIQWESGGVLRLPTPLRVRHVTDDGDWAFVEDSETGIPMSEVIVQPKPNTGDAPPPTFPLAPKADAPPPGEAEWMRNRLGADTTVRLMVKGDMGPKEISKLIKILEAQRLVLEDE